MPPAATCCRLLPPAAAVVIALGEAGDHPGQPGTFNVEGARTFPETSDFAAYDLLAAPPAGPAPEPYTPQGVSISPHPSWTTGTGAGSSVWTPMDGYSGEGAALVFGIAAYLP